MPELPEVETTRRGITPYLLNQTVLDTVVRQRQLRWPIPRSLRSLEGEVVQAVERRGKYILLRSRPGTAIIHLGMSGSLRIVVAGDELRKHDHVDLLLDSGKILRFHDPRRFGAVLWTVEDPHRHKLLASLGPEPLGDDFDGAHLFALSRKRKVAVKNFIMDGKIVVGVGNIYASEALFLAGIRPTMRAHRISLPRYIALAGAICDVLGNAIEAGGTTLRDFVNPQGNPGYFLQSLNVYGRAGEPCRRCQSPIKHKVVGQRGSFFCPRCQPAR
jgi:formamidopyrimidine-DNA glycosylase